LKKTNNRHCLLNIDTCFSNVYKSMYFAVIKSGLSSRTRKEFSLQNSKDLYTLLKHVSILSKQCRLLVFSNYLPQWKKQYLQLFKVSPFENQPQNSNVNSIDKNNYFQLYCQVIIPFVGSYDYSEEDVPLGEEEGSFNLNVYFLGSAIWTGFGNGCGRGGEYQASNKINGIGRFYFNEKFTPVVIGSEKVVYGYHPRDISEEDEENSDSDKEKSDSDKEKLDDGAMDDSFAECDEVVYKLDQEFFRFFGGSLIYDFCKNMEW